MSSSPKMDPVQRQGLSAQVPDRTKYKYKKTQQARDDLNSIIASQVHNKMEPHSHLPRSVATGRSTPMLPLGFDDAHKARILNALAEGTNRIPHVPHRLPPQSLPQSSSKPLSHMPPRISFAVPSSHTFSPKIAIPSQKLHFGPPKLEMQPNLDATTLAPRPENQAMEKLQSDLLSKSKYPTVAGNTTFRPPVTKSPFIFGSPNPNVTNGVRRNSDNFEQLAKDRAGQDKYISVMEMQRPLPKDLSAFLVSPPNNNKPERLEDPKWRLQQSYKNKPNDVPSVNISPHELLQVTGLKYKDRARVRCGKKKHFTYKTATNQTRKHTTTPSSVLLEFFKRDDIQLPRLSTSSANDTSIKTTDSQTTLEQNAPSGHLKNPTSTPSPEAKASLHLSSPYQTLADDDNDSLLDIFFDALEAQPPQPLYQHATINEIISDLCIFSSSGSHAKPNPQKKGLLYSLVTRTPQIKTRISLSNIVDLPQDTFYLFPWFPSEIRIKIWKASLPGPRFVRILETKTNKFVCTPIPALSICRESRYEALKTYELAFPVDDAPPLIPFNFEMDALFVSPSIIGRADHFRRNCSAADLARVKRLAVQDVDGGRREMWTFRDFMTRTLSSSRELVFPSLLEFYHISEFQDDSKFCENCKLKNGGHERVCLERDNVMGCEIRNLIARIHNRHVEYLIARGPEFSGFGGIGVTVVDPVACEKEKYDLPWFSQGDVVVREWCLPKVVQLHSSGGDFHHVFVYGVMDDLRRAVFR